jgi:hypothetical protein
MAVAGLVGLVAGNPFRLAAGKRRRPGTPRRVSGCLQHPPVLPRVGRRVLLLGQAGLVPVGRCPDDVHHLGPAGAGDRHRPPPRPPRLGPCPDLPAHALPRHAQHHGRRARVRLPPAREGQGPPRAGSGRMHPELRPTSPMSEPSSRARSSSGSIFRSSTSSRPWLGRCLSSPGTSGPRYPTPPGPRVSSSSSDPARTASSPTPRPRARTCTWPTTTSSSASPSCNG